MVRVKTQIVKRKKFFSPFFFMIAKIFSLIIRVTVPPEE
jgi:hypothetical protein